jgi:hypothetical protein
VVFKFFSLTRFIRDFSITLRHFLLRIGVRLKRFHLTYLLSWVLLQKLPNVQPLKNFPAFYATRRFITVFTRALHVSLYSARLIQFISSYSISLRAILILSTHLRPGLPSGPISPYTKNFKNTPILLVGDREYWGKTMVTNQRRTIDKTDIYIYLFVFVYCITGLQ